MIFWSKFFPKRDYPLGYARLKLARHRFHDYVVPAPKWPPLTLRKGYMSRLETLRDRNRGEEVVVLGNGPSLKLFDPGILKNRVSIGTNGIYEIFPEWKRTTDFIIMEDIEQSERRGKVFREVSGMPGRPLLKLVALHTAHAIPRPWPKNLCFFNARYMSDSGYYDQWGPHFSRDFAGIVWLGSTVTFIALQLAWYLGAKTVYLAGVDFNYGELEKRFPEGKLVVTKDNLDIVQQCHFSNRYHKVGDIIGVPRSSYQKRAYELARDVFQADGRKILNLTPGTTLNVFDSCDVSCL